MNLKMGPINLTNAKNEVESMDFEPSDIKNLKRKISMMEISAKMPKLVDRRASLSEEMTFLQQKLITNFTSVQVFMDDYDLELVLNGHFRKYEWNSVHSKAFLRLMKKWSEFFVAFAQNDSYFTELNHEDQALLIKNNSKLMSEYCIARYLTAKSGLEQISWICGMTNEVLCK